MDRLLSSRQQDTIPDAASHRGQAPARVIRALYLLAIVVLTMTAAQASGPRLAYFYKPPLDGTDAAFLAHHFDLIILSHADEPFRDQVRRAGYQGMILQQLAANEAEGPGPYASRHDPCDLSYPPYQRTAVDEPGMFCHQVHPNEDWFLHNRLGQRLYTRYRSANGVWRTTYDMNPGSRGWQQFLIARMRSYRSLGYDGFFLDNVALGRDGLLREPEDRGGLQEYDSDAAWRSAVMQYLEALRQALPGIPLWANLVHDPGVPGDWMPYLQYLDGMMVEDFATGWKSYPLSPQAQRQQLENIRQALAAGKDVVVVAQGEQQDQQRLETALACYWLLENGHLYFRYADAFDWDYRKVWWYPQYRFDPGRATAPLESGQRNWSRRFASGTVSIDFETGRARMPRAAEFRSPQDKTTEPVPKLPRTSNRYWFY